ICCCIPGLARFSGIWSSVNACSSFLKQADLKSRRKLKKPIDMPETVALRETRKYQKSIDLLLPRAPFIRLAKDS
ncbi:hypothetical protein MKW98_029911, partial [Papaver atlanticum]